MIQGTTISELADLVNTFPGWIASDGEAISGNRGIIMAYDTKSQKQLWLKQQFNNLAGGITCVGESGDSSMSRQTFSMCVYNTKTGIVDQYIEGFHSGGSKESVVSGVSDGVDTLYFFNGGARMQRFKITEGIYVPPPIPLIQNWRYTSVKTKITYDETKFTIVFTSDGFTADTSDSDVQARIWAWYGVENTPDDEYDCSGYSGCGNDADCPACDQDYFPESYSTRPYLTSVVVDGVKYFKYEIENLKLEPVSSSVTTTQKLVFTEQLQTFELLLHS